MKKKLQTLLIILAVALSPSIIAQTTIDISGIDETFTTEFNGELVIDVASCTSKVANPLLSFDNPFLGGDFSEAEISFDVYTYMDSIKTLGTLLSIYGGENGRMYFTNGSYLGVNTPTENWYDANLKPGHKQDVDFLGTNAWKSVKLQFTSDGFAVYINGDLAFDQESTDVNITSGTGLNYADHINFLKAADKFIIGTGSWWSDNQRDDGSYWDIQYSYMKNIVLTPDFSSGPSSVERITEADIKIYSRQGSLHIEKVENNSAIWVYNLLGKQLFYGSNDQLNGRKFLSGIYIVKVKSGDINITRKVLITD